MSNKTNLLKFLKGFIIAAPIGIYFGENYLDYPITYVKRPNNNLGYVKIDFRILDTISKDISNLLRNK